MIRIALVSEVLVMSQMKHPVSREILQHRKGAQGTQYRIQEAILHQGAVDGLVGEKTDAMQGGRREQVERQAEDKRPQCCGLSGDRDGSGGTAEINQDEHPNPCQMPPSGPLMTAAQDIGRQSE